MYTVTVRLLSLCVRKGGLRIDFDRFDVGSGCVVGRLCGSLVLNGHISIEMWHISVWEWLLRWPVRMNWAYLYRIYRLVWFGEHFASWIRHTQGHI